MVTVYLGMLFPMIAFFTVLAVALYFVSRAVRQSVTVFNSDTQSKTERRKITDRRLQIETT